MISFASSRRATAWARARVLQRPRDLGAELERGVPAPVRIVEHGAGQRHHVGLAFGDDRFGLLRRGDQADRAGRDAGLALDLLGDRHVVAGRRSDCASRR